MASFWNHRTDSRIAWVSGSQRCRLRKFARSRRLGLESLESRLLLSSPEAIWIEGEDFSSSTFNQHNWYQNSNVSKDLLSPGVPGVSDGQWHTHYRNSASTAIAQYDFNVAEGGDYAWWIRLNPFFNDEGPDYTYSVDGSAWQPINTSEVPDRIDLIDPGIDIRFIGWTFVDYLALSPGNHRVSVRVSDTSETHGGIDVMAFANFAWAPSGVLPPNPNLPTPEPDDWFQLIAGPDVFSQDSIIDMSHLIEPNAGSHGVLKRAGSNFEFADGTSVKFWGVNATAADTIPGQERQARLYTKHGINMVRQHPVESVLGVLQTDTNTGQRSFDPVKLDRWDRWFSILKANGIYMTWSLFYPHVITPDDGYPADLYAELPDKGVGKSSSGVVAFMPQLQDAQWQWEQALLNHVNPYTEMAYKDDPALAIIEVHNEDSIFWHAPLNDLTNGDLPLHEAILKQRWQQWVKGRYGDNAKMAAAWGAGKRADDSVDNVNMKIYGAWEMEADGPWGARKQVEKARMGDFIRFLAETQRGYYERRLQQLRGLDYQGVTVTTAWKAGGAAASAANLWTDDAMDAIDRHNYFGGGAGGHGITEGSVNNDTHLDQPGRGILSSGLFQVEDKPFIMTEWTQKPPNQWKAEMAPLMAFYGLGLQGWDASYHFAARRTYMGNGWPGMSSYVTATPHYLSQFPALTFAIYQGHIDEGDIVAARRLAEDDVFQGIDALSQDFTGGGYDENEPHGDLDTPTEVLAIGRVTAKVADGQEHSSAADWDVYWDREQNVVHSNTDQLTWDYTDDREVVTVHTDKTQGVIGFAGGTSFDLPGVVIDVDTDFVSLLLTPLDDRPLVDSEHILITAMAQDKQLGTVYNADGTVLIEAGGPPLLLEPVQATLRLKGSELESVKVVDIYGVPTDRAVERNGNEFTIDGRYATYYYEVRRGNPARRGDFNNDARLDCLDVDRLIGAVAATSNDGSFDITSDGLVNRADLDEWLALAGQSNLPSGHSFVPGDADLDGKVDAVDLNALALHWRAQSVGWCGGDFTADGVVNAADLNALALHWREDVSSAPMAAHVAERRTPRPPLNHVILPAAVDRALPQPLVAAFESEAPLSAYDFEYGVPKRLASAAPVKYRFVHGRRSRASESHLTGPDLTPLNDVLAQSSYSICLTDEVMKQWRRRE